MQSIVSFMVMECDEFQALCMGSQWGAIALTAIDTKKRQLNAAFLPSREDVKRTDRRARNH
jgi:hypothetical protein